jgi:hypothetical protein
MRLGDTDKDYYLGALTNPGTVGRSGAPCEPHRAAWLADTWPRR